VAGIAAEEAVAGIAVGAAGTGDIAQWAARIAADIVAGHTAAGRAHTELGPHRQRAGDRAKALRLEAALA
jgi:hypothetical protein